MAQVDGRCWHYLLGSYCVGAPDDLSLDGASVPLALTIVALFCIFDLYRWQNAQLGLLKSLALPILNSLVGGLTRRVQFHVAACHVC